MTFALSLSQLFDHLGFGAKRHSPPGAIITFFTSTIEHRTAREKRAGTVRPYTHNGAAILNWPQH